MRAAAAAARPGWLVTESHSQTQSTTPGTQTHSPTQPPLTFAGGTGTAERSPSHR